MKPIPLSEAIKETPDQRTEGLTKIANLKGNNKWANLREVTHKKSVKK